MKIALFDQYIALYSNKRNILPERRGGYISAITLSKLFIVYPSYQYIYHSTCSLASLLI